MKYVWSLFFIKINMKRVIRHRENKNFKKSREEILKQKVLTSRSITEENSINPLYNKHFNWEY